MEEKGQVKLGCDLKSENQEANLDLDGKHLCALN